LDLKGAKALRNLPSVLEFLAERHALELALLRKELEICRSEAAAQIQALREELRSMGLVKLEARCQKHTAFAAAVRQASYARSQKKPLRWQLRKRNILI